MNIFIIFAVLFQLSAYAGEEACTIDAEKFCSGYTPGGTQIRKCLKDHVHELSPDCKDFHAGIKKEVFPNNENPGKKLSKKKTNKGN